MKKRYDRELSTDELAAMPDEDIEYSDIPALDYKFWKEATLKKSATTLGVCWHVKQTVDK